MYIPLFMNKTFVLIIIEKDVCGIYKVGRREYDKYDYKRKRVEHWLRAALHYIMAGSNG